MFELERLEHFVAVARELHFGRSADQLGMDQSMLSRSIQRLEEGVGAKLFDRSRRHVRLTSAGQVFLKEAHALLQSAERAARIARQTETGQAGDIRVGLERPSSYGFLPRAIKNFRDREPEVQISTIGRSPNSLVEALKEGDLDLIVVTRTNNDRKGLHGLVVTPIRRYPFLAIVPEDWDVADSDIIKLSDLSIFPFILFSKSENPDFYNTIIESCKNAGFVPKIVQEVANLSLIVGLVAEKMGVSLLLEVGGYMSVSGVKYLPISDLPDMIHVDVLAVSDPAAAPSPVGRFVMDMLEAALDDQRKAILPGRSMPRSPIASID